MHCDIKTFTSSILKQSHLTIVADKPKLHCAVICTSSQDAQKFITEWNHIRTESGETVDLSVYVVNPVWLLDSVTNYAIQNLEKYTCT